MMKMMMMMKMMKMMGFRGDSGSKNTETSPGTTSAAHGPARLLGLKKLFHPDNVGVVRVCGGGRQGRNLILNQSIEEAKCRRAYDHATEVYLYSFDRTKPADDAILRVEHEVAVQKALSAFTSGVVGVGLVRLNYEKILHNVLRKTFEEYTKNAFLEADFQSSRIIQTMESKLRAACQVPDAKVDDVFPVLDGLVADYKSSCFGPGKCEKLVSFLQHCLEGPIQDLFKKQLDKIEAERSALKLRCASNDDNLELLKKQLESNKKHRADFLKRYEDAVSDKKRIAEDYTIHVKNLKIKCRTLEERCLSLSKSLQFINGESAGLKMKYDRILLEQKAEDEKFWADIAALETRCTVVKGRLVAVREQANSAKEEATEWRRKYEFALAEAKETRDRAAQALEHSNKKAREREDALRAKLSDKLVEKDEEIRRLNANVDHAELQASSLISKLEAAEAKTKSHELENMALKEETNRLTSKAALLERILEEREREIEESLGRSNEQRSSTVHALESLFVAERPVLAEENNQAEALSIHLQVTQSKLDALQQASVLLIETAIDSRLRTALGKRSRMDYFPATESVQDFDIDGETLRDKKRSKSTLSLSSLELTDGGGSVYGGAGDDNL